MNICGLQKTTLLDFPGHVAATVFTGGCNFRCPFCHNSELLGNDAKPLFTEEEVLKFLTKRRGILEGVAITGGEPTLQQSLPELTKAIHELDLGVISFTGHLYEQFEEQLGGCDMVLDGAFDESKLETRRKILGSTNQRVLCLTERYRSSADWFNESSDKCLEINVGRAIFANGDKI